MKIFPKIVSFLTHLRGVTSTKASPDELLGELFQDVQLRRVFPDGMTFVDLVPADRLRRILETYEQERQRSDFDLHRFVEQNFTEYLDYPATNYKTNPNHTVEQHIDELWNVLTRRAYRNKGSLMALPYPYIVPGGRFGAQWYWDSYFVMIGLAASGRYDLLEGMIKNFAYLIRKFGYIPSGNRTYYTSRSQPPFFSHMVRLLAEKEGKTVLVRYLPYMLAEYRFWTLHAKELTAQHPTYRRSVLMPNGALMARYFDNKRTPRPESYKEDVDTALKAADRVPSKVYVDIRATAESGWDFTSRWLKDGKNMHSIYTTDIIPVDLNCLLIDMANTIADIYEILMQTKLAERFRRRAERRTAALNEYCWNEEKGFYFDYDFIAKEQTPSYSLAAAFPLYSQAASQKQADAVAQVLREKFLKEGGLVSTLETTGEQWDAPNGWAPLHWVTIQGLRNYGHDELANEIKKRWIDTNLALFKSERKLVEKYDVVNPGKAATGGEYVLQDGFGWTNGVLRALLKEDQVADKKEK